MNLGELIEALTPWWSEFFHRPIPERPETFFAKGYGPGGGSLVIFGNDGHPACFVKFAAGKRRALQAEEAALRHLRDALPDGLSASVPRPILLGSAGGSDFLAVTHLYGTPALSLLLARPARRGAAGEVFGRAARWLATLRAATGAGERPLLSEEVDGWVAEVADADGLGRIEPMAAARLERLARAASGTVGLSVPFALRHGDFWPGNILVQGDRLAVVDWEGARFCAPAIHDLFDLAVGTSQYRRGRRSDPADYARNLAEDFLEAGPVGRFLASELEALGIPPDEAAPLFGLHTARMAFSELLRGEFERTAFWQGFLEATDGRGFALGRRRMVMGGYGLRRL